MLGRWQAAWQGVQVACLCCSCLQLVLDCSHPAHLPALQMMIGCFVCGWLMRRFGRPAGIQACGLFNIVGAVVQVCGVGWGGVGRGGAGWGGVGRGGAGWGRVVWCGAGRCTVWCGVGWGGVGWAVTGLPLATFASRAPPCLPGPSPPALLQVDHCPQLLHPASGPRHLRLWRGLW